MADMSACRESPDISCMGMAYITGHFAGYYATDTGYYIGAYVETRVFKVFVIHIPLLAKTLFPVLASAVL